MNIKRTYIAIVLFLAILGLFDASYLTYEHFSQSVPPCSVSIWVDCGRVLKSSYATIAGLPVAMLGLAYYSTMVGISLIRWAVDKEMTIKDVLWRILEKYARPKALSLQKMLFFIQLGASSSALAFSVYFVYLQLWVIHAICLYCMFSALLSLLLWKVTILEYVKVQRKVLQ